ncbi:MAG: hypothetical protein GY822_10435 [Deltaproteobacteria bacterium]|nr:hypothetical protein [Deltaproteobacteria bacterium]
MSQTESSPVDAKEPLTSARRIKRALFRSLGNASKCRNTNNKKAKQGPGLLIDHCPSYKTLDKDQKITLTLDPSGKVTNAYFRDSAANESDIGACITESLMGWSFAPFDGVPVDITQRVSFEPCVPINNVCVF